MPPDCLAAEKIAGTKGVAHMNADVIIIGAGAIGTACAYFLSRRGVKVLVLERHHLCAGASGATASMISFSGTSGTPEQLQALNLESHRLIQEIEADFESPMEKISGGSLFVAMNEQEAEEIRPSFEEVRQMGIECKFLDGDDARRLEPLLSPKVTAAIFTPANYHVSPFRLCSGYLSGALRRDGAAQYGVRVRDVKVQNGRIDRVITDSGDYHADWVVVAAGAWTAEILQSIDTDIPIVPARGQVILTEACPPMTNHMISFLNHMYLKQTASGNFYLGSHTEFVGFENNITLEKITAYTKVPFQVVPMLTRLRAIRFFTGFRPISADELPIIGPVPGCPQLIMASGHGRTGMRYSASTGKAVSELVVDGKTELPIDAFAVDRFEEPPEN